jgi:hypothetical protein
MTRKRPCAVRLGQQFAMFTDWTRSIFEESKLRPLEWLLVIGLWQLKLNATEIATFHRIMWWRMPPLSESLLR